MLVYPDKDFSLLNTFLVPRDLYFAMCVYNNNIHTLLAFVCMQWSGIGIRIVHSCVAKVSGVVVATLSVGIILANGCTHTSMSVYTPPNCSHLCHHYHMLFWLLEKSY